MRRRTKPARSIYTRSWHQVMISAAAACQCFVIYKHKRLWRGRRVRRGTLPPRPSSPAEHPVPQNLAQSCSIKGTPTKPTLLIRGCKPHRAFAVEQHEMLDQQHLKGSWGDAEEPIRLWQKGSAGS